MKLIGVIQGFAAMRERPEEYFPSQGVVYNEQVELIRSRYEFQIFPQIVMGMPPAQIMVFGAGKFNKDGESFAINQLSMKEDGDVVLTTTTDQANMVLNDLIEALDERLGFRLKTSNTTRSYLSNVVVEFDVGLENMIRPLGEIIAAINERRSGKSPANIKRLAFGEGDVRGVIGDPLLAVEIADFLIERRQGSPYAGNRYFCSAPLQTSDHIHLLERIEEIAMASGTQ